MKPTSPCVSLLLSILAPIVAFTTTAAAEPEPATYVADGVNLKDILNSTRFYDTGKGLYWKQTGQPYNGAQQLYNQYGGFSFMRDLQNRISGTEFRPAAFDNLVNDGTACWYCVAANVIQYWESYYGVFYKGDAPLPYGYTYDKKHLSPLGGTQSLDIHMSFYDSWILKDNTVGGDSVMAIEWYLATGKNINAGKPNYAELRPDAPCKGAFYSDYFQGNAAARENYYMGGDTSDLRSATDFLMEAFGYDRDGERTTYGQIAYVGLLTPIKKEGKLTGHALTCYGCTLNSDGLLESLYLTNSDDKNYSVFQAFVGVNEQGFLHLYQDAAHTKDWMYADLTWNLCDITYINTPTLLKEMYDEYTHAALVWSGTRSTWSDKDAAEATTETLPGAQAGWKVFALDDYYDSYYQAGREVAFTDTATKTDVSLKGALSAPAVRIDNNAKDYTFTGTTGTTLKTDLISKLGSGSATFSKVAITAKTVDVDMGSLILGTGANLTAQSGEVDNMGTLALSGGTASFSNGLDICSSGTLAVNTATTLTTSLTLQDSSYLYFNLGSGNTSTPLLTLNGSLNVLGDSYLTVNGAALTAGQDYILASVSGSISGWNDISTNSGTITLSGKQLVLHFAKPDTLTWNGGSNVWSATQWNGTSTQTEGKDLIFSRAGSTTVTVQGTVSPNSMLFNQGNFTLATGSGATINGCRTITLANGANLTSAVPLTGADISLGAGSTLTMKGLSAGTSEVSGLEMAAGSKLVLCDSTRYVVQKAGALNGTVELQDTASLLLRSAIDTEFYGNLVGNANTEVILMNSAGDRDVVFYVGKDPADFKGTITIGTNDDGAPLTTLRIGSAIRNFTINKNGELSLRGRGDISGKIEGSGTLTIEHDATFQLAKDGQVAFGHDVLLNVEGTAEIGTNDAPLPRTTIGDISVSGQLSVHYKSPGSGEALKVDSLTLRDGGVYTLIHSFPEMGNDLTSRHVINKLTVANGGTLSNTLASVAKPFTLSYPRTIEIGELSGGGTLTLEAENQSYVTQTIISDTATEGYGGDLLIRNPHCAGYSYKDKTTGAEHFVNTGLTVEMCSGTINGCIVLDAQGFAAEPQDASRQSGLIHGGLAAFGIRGDVAVHGIDDSSSSKTTYLYSGAFQGETVYVDSDTLFSFLDRIEPEHHTLTLNGTEDYDFHGKVYAYLNLDKQGSGKQTFSGDLSAFEGNLTVSGGELAFTHAIHKATAVTLNGGTLRLHGGNLENVGGSGGTLILEAEESGASYDIGFTNAESGYTMQLNGVTATLSGLAPAITVKQDSTIQAAADTALVLQAPITNEATLTMKGAFDASKLALTTTDTHIDTEGNTGDSGFAYTGASVVTIVNGGTSIGTDAIITHSELQGKQFTLGKNGKAATEGVKDLTSYLLTGTDKASVAAINAQAGSKLASIDMKGGTLTVDAATDKLQAVGGRVNITKNVALGGTAKDTAISASTTATLNTILSGNSSITKTGSGTLTVSKDNSHSGKTTITGGVLNISNKNALGTGNVTLSGGTLQISTNDFANTVTSSGTSAINVADTYTLALKKALDNSGTLTISGKIDASALLLTEDGSTHVDVNGKTGASGFTKSGVASVTIVNGGTTNGTGATIKHNKLQSGTLILGSDGKATSGGTIDYSTYLLTGTDTVSVSAINKKAGAQLKSIDVQSGTITADTTTDKLNTTGGTVNITNGVTVGGRIADTRIKTSGGTITAAITGTSAIDINPGSTVFINRANDYTGDTGVFDAGAVLRVSNKDALGSGKVYLTCGTLEVACNELANTVTSTCHDSVLSVLNGYVLKLTESNKISNLGGSASITLKGVFDASALKLSDNDTRIDTAGNAGASGFALRGARSVTIVNGGTCKDGGATIKHDGLKSGTLVLGKNGVASTSGTMDYSSYLLTGSDKATLSTVCKQAGNKLQSVIMEGGTLTVDTGTDKVSATGGTLNITAGGAVRLNRDNALTGTQVTLNGGSLALNGHKQGIDIKLTKASTLSTGGDAQVNSLQVSGQGVEDSNGKLLFADELTLNGTLTTGSFTLTKGDIKSGTIAVTQEAEVQQGYIGADISGNKLVKSGAGKRVELGGKNTFTGGVSVNEGSLALLEGSKMQADITVKNNAALLTAIDVNGSISLESGAIMRLRPNATYSLKRGLAAAGAQFYGNLTTEQGAALTLNATNAAALTVNGNATLSGGSITYAGTAHLNVTGALTLQNATKANVTWSSGSHKLATAGSIQTNGHDLYEFFDLAPGAYTLQATSTDITVKVEAMKSPALMRMAGITAPAGLAQAQPGMPDEMQPEGGRAVQTQAPITYTLVKDVADALVQADWGTVHAARAFNGTLNGRHQSLRAICNGRTAVWADAIGSTTRQSSTHGHAGADHNLYGGVFGVEFNAGTRGAAGLAIGHTWDRVNTFGMSRVKQDSQHAGAFGRAKLTASGAHSLWLEASASYGKTDSRGTLGASRERWSQDSCTLNVHANDVWQLDEETAVNFFGGLEYVATDSGHIDDLRTGSVQNLRGEIGAGVTRTIGRGMVFAEASLTGDMVRHNPQADLGTRRGGANPGRIGGSISVGGAYILNAHWSVNATYTFEGVKHNNSHNASVGATFRF